MLAGVLICAMLAVLLGGLAVAGILGEGDVILALATLAVGITHGNGYPAGYGLGRWVRP